MLLSEKIKELEKIFKENGEMTLVSRSDNYELRGAFVDNEGAAQIKKMKRVEKTFFDDFDNEPYSKSVYEEVSDEENSSVNVIII